MELMKPYWKLISASLSPVGRLLLLVLIVGLALSGSGSNAESSQEAIDDAEKLGACVATKVFSPPGGAGPSVGCDYVLKLAAAGSFPVTEQKYVDDCCRLLISEAKTDCVCPHLGAMDGVCRIGVPVKLREQCSKRNSQDGTDLAGKLGACVTSKVFAPPRGASEPVGCDYILRLAAAGSFPDTEEDYLNQCCDLLTEAESSCVCPLLANAAPDELFDMGSVCNVVAALPQCLGR